jgi:hypothetical protein
MDTQEHGATRPFGESMGLVANLLLGTPNQHLSSEKEMRYGRHGSVHVDLASGTFYDHEAKQGGGVLDLIVRETGCDHKGALDWLRKNGFLDVEPKTNGAAQAKKREVAHYDYTDESGDLIFQVVRFEPKTFVQRRKERGRWLYQVKGVRQVPYHLPEISEAIANERTVFIVEGEKDADNLAKWNIAATCNAGGVGKWRDEFAMVFQDADVVVIPDNDDVGRAHANAVAASVAAGARRVGWLELPALPHKGDVSDWIAAGGTAEAFHALVERAPAWGQRINSRFGGLRWEDIGRFLGPVGYTWLVEDVVPLGEITLVYGDSGTGKSFDMFHMAMCVARGEQFNGRNVEPGLVVYVAAEAGKGFAKRKIAYSIQHQLEPANPLPFYLCTKRPNFFHDDLDAVALIEEIKAVAASYNIPLRLIVIDTLSALAPGMNENASQDVSMVRKRLVMLQEQFEAAVILVHHKPKGGNTPRGHGSLTADFETTIEFETLSDLKTPEGKTIHKATVRKQREGKNGIAWSFTLPVIEVGKNKWGNPETSCVVHPLGEQRQGAVGFHANASEKQLLHALYEALSEHPQPPPAGLPKEIARVVNYRHVYELMKSRFINPEDDQEKAAARFRQAFKRAATALRDGAVIGVQGELYWPTGKPVNGFTSPRIDGGDF